MPDHSHAVKSRSMSIAILSIFLYVSHAAIASEPVTPDVTDVKASDNIEHVDVYGVRETNVLPVTHSGDVLFGTPRSLLDTTRQATVINSELLDTLHISEMKDLSLASSNTYSPNTFGASSLPTIRGDLGEIFQNGLRRMGGNNGFGFPTSFNSLESLEVIKGPPPVPLGPTQRVGGFINMVTKKPFFDQYRGEFSLGTGGFQGGDTFARKHYNLDVGGPLSTDALAHRLSIEVVRDKEFYDYAETQSEDIYWALGYRPSDDLKMDFNVEYFSTKFDDIAGFNRPTQALIDHGTYITGVPTNGNSAYPGLNAVVDGKNVISPTGTVKLDRNHILNHPGDASKANDLLLQFAVEKKLNEGMSLTNRTLYQDLSKNEVETNSFVEVIDIDKVFQNRTDLAFDFSTGTIQHNSVLGLDLRYQRVKGVSQFDTEADDPIDLTAPIDSRRIPINDLRFQSPALNAVRAHLVYSNSLHAYVSPGANYDINGDGAGDFYTSDSTDSDAMQYGLFVQDDIHFSSQWLLLLGARGDFYDVTARDAMPPQAVLDNPTIKRAEVSASEFVPSANASLTFKPKETSSIYLNYNTTKAPINSLGGGYTLSSDPSTNTHSISKSTFKTDSELIELGTKTWWLDKKLWMSTAVFNQTRSLRNRDGSVSGIKTKGAEYELTYQPTPTFYTNVNLSYLDTRFDNSVAYQGTKTVADAFDNSRPDIIAGTGGGGPNFTAFPASRNTVPGIPKILASTTTSYTSSSGFGGYLGLLFNDKYRLDYLNTVHINAQYTLNGGLFYRAASWEVKLDVFNITNQENFTTNFNGYFGGSLVFPEEPLSYLLTLKYRL
jgi:outer membrane receptor protein involved in Fe transport